MKWPGTMRCPGMAGRDGTRAVPDEASWVKRWDGRLAVTDPAGQAAGRVGNGAAPYGVCRAERAR